jgi:hypothetical protein
MVLGVVHSPVHGLTRRARDATVGSHVLIFCRFIESAAPSRPWIKHGDASFPPWHFVSRFVNNCKTIGRRTLRLIQFAPEAFVGLHIYLFAPGAKVSPRVGKAAPTRHAYRAQASGA